MNDNEKLLLSKALDGLYGAVDAAHDVAAMIMDSCDGRLEQMKDGLSKAQDAIMELNEAFGIEKH